MDLNRWKILGQKSTSLHGITAKHSLHLVLCSHIRRVTGVPKGRRAEGQQWPRPRTWAAREWEGPSCAGEAWEGTPDLSGWSGNVLPSEPPPVWPTTVKLPACSQDPTTSYRAWVLRQRVWRQVLMDPPPPRPAALRAGPSTPAPGCLLG